MILTFLLLIKDPQLVRMFSPVSCLSQFVDFQGKFDVYSREKKGWGNRSLEFSKILREQLFQRKERRERGKGRSKERKREGEIIF